MIEGITVLNSYSNGLGILGIFLYAMILVGFLLSVGLFCSAAKDKFAFGIAFSSISIAIFLVLFGITTYKCFIKEPDTYYQVVLDENVSYLEFTEKYEVIEQNGQIYTIKEKEGGS